MQLSKITIQIVSVLCVTASAALLQTSCISSPSAGGNTAHVEVASSGIIFFRGEPVAAGELGKTLRKHGYNSMSPVKVHIPDQTPGMIIKTISTALSKNGFRRVLFLKPKHATANVSEKK